MTRLEKVLEIEETSSKELIVLSSCPEDYFKELKDTCVGKCNKCWNEPYYERAKI